MTAPAQLFERFAATACADAPTWQRVASLAARTPAVLSLCDRTRDGQQPPNLLLGALHWLLLDGDESPRDRLARMRDDEIVAFLCDHGSTVRELVRSRLVQTNEVRRCSYLLPALSWIAARSDRPLALVEVGSSAGLLLRVHRYRYDYGPAGTVENDSAVLIRPEVRGVGQLPVTPVPLARAVGIDLEPIDPDDAEAVRWLRALVWPDHPERMALLETALAEARRDRPAQVAGDALEVLPEVLAGLPSDVLPVVFHSFVLMHWRTAARARFVELVRELREARPLVWLRTEITDPPLQADDTVLARHHQHGAWVEWLA